MEESNEKLKPSENGEEKQNTTQVDVTSTDNPMAEATTADIAPASETANNDLTPPSAPEVTEATATAEPVQTEANTPNAEDSVDEGAVTAAHPDTTVDNEQASAFVEPEEDYSVYTREMLVDKMQNLLQSDISQIKNRVSAVRSAFSTLNRDFLKAQYDQFIADGGNKDEYEQKNDSVAEAFYKLVNDYRERRQQYQDEQDAIKQNNLQTKQELLDELKKVVEADIPLKQSYDEFNAIQDKWKATGDVPRDKANDIWQNYHHLVGLFYDKVKINHDLKQLDMKKNLEQKIELCEKAEELIVDPSVTEAFRKLKDLFDRWREIGPVPNEHNEEVWTRFCNARDKITERHREYFEQRREELEKNLLAKQALIEQATTIVSQPATTVKGWNDKSEQLDELLKVWKTIGPVPREQNDTVWNQFKSILDNFYLQKREYFGQRRDEQTENYNKKLDLCQRAEAIANRDDWRAATDELLALQEEWKQVGPVSKKHADKVWQRFRGACDEFFSRKSEYFNSRRESEKDNLAKKEAILEQMRSYQYSDNEEENLRVLKDFQRQWLAVGYVPNDQKDRLRTEYRQLLDGLFERLKISARQAEELAANDRQRVGNNNRSHGNESQNGLALRIERLRNDINVWENNLGFLSNSKQAELLKREFEKKVQNARQQLALLEAKLRMANEAAKESKNTPNTTAEAKPAEDSPKENGAPE